MSTRSPCATAASANSTAFAHLRGLFVPSQLPKQLPGAHALRRRLELVASDDLALGEQHRIHRGLDEADDVSAEHAEEASVARPHPRGCARGLAAEHLVELALEGAETHAHRADLERGQLELLLRGADVERSEPALDILDHLGRRLAEESELGQDALTRPEEVELRAQVLRGMRQRRAAENVTADRCLREAERRRRAHAGVAGLSPMRLVECDVGLMPGGPGADEVEHVGQQLVCDQEDFSVISKKGVGHAAAPPSEAGDRGRLARDVALLDLLLPGEEGVLRGTTRRRSTASRPWSAS